MPLPARPATPIPMPATATAPCPDRGPGEHSAGTQGKDDFWMKMYDGFAEDTWKLMPNLTVTAGVRYDIQLTPNPGQVNHLFDPISSEYTSTIKNVIDRVQPRVAFSWSHIPAPWFEAGTDVLGAQPGQHILRDARGERRSAVELHVRRMLRRESSHLPNTSGSRHETAVPECSLHASRSGAIDRADPDRRRGAHRQPPANASISTASTAWIRIRSALRARGEPSVEQALPGKLSLQMGYVGTRGMRLPVFVDANLVGVNAQRHGQLHGAGCEQQHTKTITVPVYLPTDRRDQALSSFNTGYSVANTWYNSLAVTVRRPFSNGLEVLGNYTWAKATDAAR